MTLFWLYQLRAAIMSFREARGLEMLPSEADFQDVLLHTPRLMYARLWSEYYSKEVVFSPDARDSWRLPDVQPLPGFTPLQTKPVGNPRGDQNAASDRLIRFGHAVVRSYLKSGKRRGAVVSAALDALRSATMGLRAKDASLVPPYSETQAYFWIQIVHAACGEYEQPSTNGTAAAAVVEQQQQQQQRVPVSELSYQTFTLLFDLSPGLWKAYYSPKRWDSLEGRSRFLDPDVKSLPNIIRVPSSGANLTRAINSRISEGSLGASTDLPSFADLVVLAKQVAHEACSMREPVDDIIHSHAQLLLNLFNRLSSTRHRSHSNGHDGPSRTNHLASALTELDGPLVPGYTSRAFWSSQMLAAWMSWDRHREAEAASNGDGDGDGGKEASTFAPFIVDYPHLAYEKLPFVYYSPEVWTSLDAQQMVVGPDRRPLPRTILTHGVRDD